MADKCVKLLRVEECLLRKEGLGGVWHLPLLYLLTGPTTLACLVFASHTDLLYSRVFFRKCCRDGQPPHKQLELSSPHEHISLRQGGDEHRLVNLL